MTAAAWRSRPTVRSTSPFPPTAICSLWPASLTIRAVPAVMTSPSPFSTSRKAACLAGLLHLYRRIVERMVRGVALDPSGNLLITGYTLSRNFPVTSDAAQHAYAGAGDIIVAAVNAHHATAFLKYATFLGGSDGDVAYAVATDPSGNIYVPVTRFRPISRHVECAAAAVGAGNRHLSREAHTACRRTERAAIFHLYRRRHHQSGVGIAVGPDGTAYVGGKTGGELPTSATRRKADSAAGAPTVSLDRQELGSSSTASRQKGARLLPSNNAPPAAKLSPAGHGSQLCWPRPSHGPIAGRGEAFPCDPAPLFRSDYRIRSHPPHRPLVLEHPIRVVPPRHRPLRRLDAFLLRPLRLAASLPPGPQDRETRQLTDVGGARRIVSHPDARQPIFLLLRGPFAFRLESRDPP